MFYSTWIRLSYGFFDQFGYYDRYCCIINMNMFIVIFLYLCKCICMFFVPLINLMRYFVIFVMFSIIKHNSYHVMVHDWNKIYYIITLKVAVATHSDATFSVNMLTPSIAIATVNVNMLTIRVAIATVSFNM